MSNNKPGCWSDISHSRSGFPSSSSELVKFNYPLIFPVLFETLIQQILADILSHLYTI
jgi:hypothetical protein